MARQRKFPIPATDKEIPYDRDGFIKWAREHQGLAEFSAKQYVSEIKTAYLTLFGVGDTLFDDLKTAFTPKSIEEVPENWRRVVSEHSLIFDKVLDIEDEYINLCEYCNKIESINDDNATIYPMQEWLRAFKTYARYIKWRIIEIYENSSYSPLLAAAPLINEPSEIKIYEIPLKNEFMEYLRLLHKKQDPDWEPKSQIRKDKRKNTYQGEIGVYSNISRLTKLYNLILLRRISLDTLKNLKDSLTRKQRPRFKRIYNTLCRYIEWDRPYCPEISEQDVYYGLKTLEQYFDFMKEYSEDPMKYERRPFKRKTKSDNQDAQ